MMLRKKLVKERRENAQKKKAADQSSKPENRITQNALTQDSSIFASPPAYQNIYSKFPMPAMVPMPVFYYDAEDGSGGNAFLEEMPDEERMQGFYPEGEALDEQESSGENIAEPYELPSEEESGNLSGSEEKAVEFAESEYGNSGSGFNEVSRNIDQGKEGGTGEQTEGEASNRDDTAANGAAAPQGGGDQAGAKPAAAGQEAGQQTAGQQAPQPAKEDDKGKQLGLCRKLH